MDIEEIRRAVRAAIESVAPDADLQGIRPDRPLREQVDLDSMDWLNVLAGLHDRLSIEIPESDYGRLATVDSIVAYLASRRAEQPDEPQGGMARAVAEARAKAPPARTSHLVNGTWVTVRPIRRDDVALEAGFVRNLSDESRYKRFMASVRELSRVKLDSLTAADQVRDVALAATVSREGRPVIVGVARYSVDAGRSGCEFAVAVDDAWHGTGLAGILMHALMRTARDRGLRTIEGIVLPTNSRMLKLARQLGFRRVRDPADRDTVRIVRAL